MGLPGFGMRELTHITSLLHRGTEALERMATAAEEQTATLKEIRDSLNEEILIATVDDLVDLQASDPAYGEEAQNRP